MTENTSTIAAVIVDPGEHVHIAFADTYDDAECWIASTLIDLLSESHCDALVKKMSDSGEPLEVFQANYISDDYQIVIKAADKIHTES